ncbi:MAG: hypothetical protein V1772_02940 [Chloroflexota bacterium]
MKVQCILGTPPFMLLGITIARLLPRRWADALCRRLARDMARRRNTLFRTLRANHRHVLGPGLDDEALDRHTERALYYLGRTYVDILRATVRDFETGRLGVRVATQAEHDRILADLRDPRGTVLVGPHLSSFDLAAQWLAYNGFELQMLSLANPDAGTRFLNWFRQRRGLLMTPIGVQALRQGVRRLRQGGIVVTGVDRRISDDDPPVPFFDAPARMPTGHVRLALQTGAHVLVACCLQEPDGRYRLMAAPALEMERTGDRERDVAHNVRRVLAICEEMIRLAPEQWLMLLPVWEEDMPV